MQLVARISLRLDCSKLLRGSRVTSFARAVRSTILSNPHLSALTHYIFPWVFSHLSWSHSYWWLEYSYFSESTKVNSALVPALMTGVFKIVFKKTLHCNKIVDFTNMHLFCSIHASLESNWRTYIPSGAGECVTVTITNFLRKHSNYLFNITLSYYP